MPEDVMDFKSLKLRSLLIAIFIFVSMQVNLFADWNNRVLPIIENVVGVSSPSAGTNQFVLFPSTLYYTTNNGSNWIAANSPFYNIATAIYFLDNQNGYVGNESGLIANTTTGGSGWSITTITNFNVNSIHFFSSTNGIAVGNFGKIYYTNDAGSSWNAGTNSNSQNINSVCMVSNSVAYAVCNSGFVLKTTNGGMNWSTNATLGTNKLNSISVSSATFVAICGDGGTIYTTTNSGTNWSANTTGTTNNLNSISYAAANTIYAVGNNGLVIKTTNGGTNWIVQTSNAGIKNITTVSFANADRGLAAGTTGLVLTTTNGGRVFNPTISVTSPTLNNVYRIGSELPIAWLAIDVNNVLIRYSANGGGDNYSNTIGTFNANSGSTSLLLSSGSFTSTANGRILISDLSNSAVNDTSKVFSIDDWTLAFTSLNSSATMYSSNTVTLNWLSANVSNVNIEYQNNNSGVWTPLTINYSATLGTYNWILPEIANANVRFRIYDPSKTHRADTTDANLTIVNPSLQITSPNGGEVYNYPNSINIIWNATPNLTNIDLEYSNNNGSSWQTIQTNVAANLGTLNWSFPNSTSANNLIRIKRNGTSTYLDTSNAVFRINGIPLQLNTPIAGAKWKVGSTRAISWAADNSVLELNIDFTTNGGTSWVRVASNLLASDNSYNWLIPNEPTSNAKIRLTSSSNTATSVTSSLFSIVNLRISSSLENKTIVATTSEPITWSAFGLDFVNIKYRLNNSSTWTTIQSNVAANSSFTWSVPDLVSSTAKLRLEFVSDTTVSSEVSINLVRANFAITSPTQGSYLKSGSIVPITWTSAYISNVRIDYRNSSTASWNLIINNANASTGRYNWSVPSVLTDSAQLRFTYVIGNNPTSYQMFSETFSISNSDVILTSPNGLERMVPGTTRVIKWKYSNLTNVDLMYTTDGVNYIDIPSGQGLLASNQQFSWTIPNAPTLIAKVRIRNSSAPIINDVSDSTFAISGVRMTAPASSTQLLVGSVVNVKWMSALVNRVDIFYTINNGTTWLQIAKDYPAVSGNFAWQVPNNPSSIAIIKVVDSENSTLKDSVTALTLQGLTITKPDNTSNWLVGEDYNIEWRSAAIGEVRLDYSTNGGSSWITIMSNLNATDGTFTWNVPKTPVDSAIVRISHLDNPSFNNISSKFVIRGNGIVVKAPTESQVITAASGTFTVPITWTYSNISTVNIEYSTNGGMDWNTLVNGITASNRSYNWIVNANTVVSSKEYKIRLSDAENIAIRDSSGLFSIKGASGYTVPKSWEFTNATGNNAVIIIPNRSGIIPTVLDININQGDAIGVFYTSNGLLKCAGYTVYDTTYNTAITVWGDNPSTASKDGFIVNETYTYKIWDSNTGIDYNANAVYSSGNSFYTSSVSSLGVSILSSLKGFKRLSVNLRANRWSMISTNLLPKSLTMDSMIAPIRTKLVQVKDEGGRIFMPSQSINQLTTWDLSTGYEVYTNSDATWTVDGSSVTPINYAKTIIASQWHIIAYLRQTAATPATVFASYPQIIMSKDADGNIYYPAFNINTIGTMQPGQAYKLVSNTTFGGFYTSAVNAITTPISSMFKLNDSQFETVYFKPKYKATGSSSVILVNLQELEFGDEIAVFNSKNDLVGASFSNGSETPIVIWGDDLSTAMQDGANDGELLHLQLWQRKINKISTLEIKKVTDKLSSMELGNSIVYTKDAILETDCALASTGVEDNKSDETGIRVYPNPTSDFVSIVTTFDMNKIRLIDNLGKVVLEQNVDNDKIELNLKQLSKGAYTIEIQTQTGVSYQKLLVQ